MIAVCRPSDTADLSAWELQKKKPCTEHDRSIINPSDCRVPIALHICDSTLHLLQCPSGRLPLGGADRFGNTAFSFRRRPGLFGEGTHRYRTSI